MRRRRAPEPKSFHLREPCSPRRFVERRAPTEHIPQSVRGPVERHPTLRARKPNFKMPSSSLFPPLAPALSPPPPTHTPPLPLAPRSPSLLPTPTYPPPISRAPRAIHIFSARSLACMRPPKRSRSHRGGPERERSAGPPRPAAGPSPGAEPAGARRGSSPSSHASSSARAARDPQAFVASKQCGHLAAHCARTARPDATQWAQEARSRGRAGGREHQAQRGRPRALPSISQAPARALSLSCLCAQIARRRPFAALWSFCHSFVVSGLSVDRAGVRRADWGAQERKRRLGACSDSGPRACGSGSCCDGIYVSGLL